MNTNTEREEPSYLAFARANVRDGRDSNASIVGRLLARVDALEKAAKPRVIESPQELDALPVGAVVLAHWPDGSQSDYQMMRCPEGAASAGGGFGVAGGSHWLNMTSWGAELTALYTPEPTR